MLLSTPGPVESYRTYVTQRSADALPVVVLDGDTAGRQFKRHLRQGFYSNAPERVIDVADYVDIEGAETEDLWPPEELCYVLTRYLRGPEREFDEFYEPREPIVPQVERYAEEHSIELKTPGWKAEVAVRAQRRLLQDLTRVSKKGDFAKTWKRLFTDLAA